MKNDGASAFYYPLVRAAWIPCTLMSDPLTDEYRRVEGAPAFETYREAVEARRSLSRPARAPSCFAIY
jgi:hypothetical protein